METAEEPMTPFGTFTAQSNKLQRVCSLIDYTSLLS